MIPGIDVSHWQSTIEWSLVKAAGVQFAWIKSSEFHPGKTIITPDPMLEINLAGTKNNDILCGIYHFYRTHIDPAKQAQAVLDTIKGLPFDFPLAIDLELAGMRGVNLNNQVSAFIAILEAELKYKPIIYTSGGFWRSLMIYDKFQNVNWATGFTLWLAQYTQLWPSTPYPFAGWHFWQYTDKGRIPGIKTFVDLNWFNRDYVDLLKLSLPITQREQL